MGFGEFQMMNSRFASLVTGFWPIYPANTLVVTGTIACCVCYVGVFGAMKENRCMLIMVRGGTSHNTRAAHTYTTMLRCVGNSAMSTHRYIYTVYNVIVVKCQTFRCT